MAGARGRVRAPVVCAPRRSHPFPVRTPFFVTLVAGPRRSLTLELSDTRVCEPQIRARLGPLNNLQGDMHNLFQMFCSGVGHVTARLSDGYVTISP